MKNEKMLTAIGKIGDDLIADAEICPKAAKIWKVGSVARILDLRYCHVCTLCAMECPTDCIKIIRPGEEP